MSATTMETRTLELPAEAARPSLWQNRTFISIWIGHTLSILGDGFNSVALGLWVLQTTGSASAMAVIMTVRTLVAILLGPVAGTYVDRADRRKVMLLTDLARFLVVGLLALLVKAPGASLLPVVALSGLTAVFSQFFSPAFQASLANIVRKDDLARASGLLQMTNTLSMVAGPLLGGTMVALFGGWTALSIDSISFLVSAALILLGGAFASPRKEGESASFWTEMKEGIAYIRKEPLVRTTATLSPALNFFANALGGVLMPVIAVRLWHASSVEFGALEAFFPLGFAVGAGLYTAFAKKPHHRGRLIILGGAVGSVLMTLAPLAPSVEYALPLYLICGMGIALPNVIFQIMMQSEVPVEMQGRVFGTTNSLCMMANPLAFMIAGFLSDRFSPVLIAVAAGIMLVLTMVGGMLLSPAIRNYK